MVAILNDSEVERVGQYEMRIRFGEHTAESDAGWQRRSEVLAAWLIDQWKRRQREIVEGN